jgi:hypothetical protein
MPSSKYRFRFEVSDMELKGIGFMALIGLDIE